MPLLGALGVGVAVQEVIKVYHQLEILLGPGPGSIYALKLVSKMETLDNLCSQYLTALYIFISVFMCGQCNEPDLLL